MGTKQSSLAKSASTETNEETPKLEVKLSGERGLMTVNQEEDVVEEFEVDTDTDSDDDSEEESDGEEDEEFTERLRILDDAKKLKALAVAFLHPETPVRTTDPTAFARCYFDRASAPEQESVGEAEYRRHVLEDAAALKVLAVDYAHPELGVATSDPTATARCYFDRVSAPEQEDEKEAEYRRQVLEDAAVLKVLAVDYAHPELGVVTSDPTATARCYFDRASAPERESLEEVDYRRQVLEDASALKELAAGYAHPEIGVVASDPTACARCYFDRASAPEQEDEEVAEYRRQVLEDAAALKRLAVDYAHPEMGVTTSDPTATARCYFGRASATEQESLEDVDYRHQALEDAAVLKKLAIAYAHPEIGVVTSDPTATARCYFDRASAPEQDDLEQAEYRRQVLEDAASLKKIAVDYAHPELGVATSDPTATARCYFDRASAPEQEDEKEAEYRRQVLEDAAALKKLAVDYAHPELGVVTSDPTATARCYFDRASAPERESLEEDSYHQQVLEDALALKKLAVDYAYPEIGVVASDPTATARCYFDRASAPQHEEAEGKPEASPQGSAPVSTKKAIVLPIKKNAVVESSKTVKTVDPSKNADIGRSLSSVQLFGLDGEGGSSY